MVKKLIRMLVKVDKILVTFRVYYSIDGPKVSQIRLKSYALCDSKETSVLRYLQQAFQYYQEFD